MVDDTELCLIEKAAAEFFPRPLCKRSVMQRIQVGRRGVRLEAVCDGGRWFTCRRWVSEFLHGVTEQSTGAVRSPAATERAVAAAKERLARRRARRGKKEARAKVSVRR